jgi:hypothetical protein
MILSTHGLIASQIQSYAFLLDTYTSAAAAYSLRKLRSAYTGNAIRVRRSSDNTETNIGFSSSFGLDTTTLSSFCSGTNGFVTTWYDQSGNGRNATQTTAANQPQIVNAGSIITDIGGDPTLKFNGNQWINNASTFTISQPFTNFSVCKFSSFTSPTEYPYVWRSQLGNDSNLVIMGYLGQLRIYSGANLFSSVTPSNDSLLFYGIYNGASSTIGINTATNTGDQGTNSLINGISFGTYDTSVGQLNGFISESIFYPSNQSSNVSGINTNINTYYGIY